MKNAPDPRSMPVPASHRRAQFTDAEEAQHEHEQRIAEEAAPVIESDTVAQDAAERAALRALLGPAALSVTADALYEWLTGRYGETLVYLDEHHDDDPSTISACRTLLTVLDAGGTLSLAGGYYREALARVRHLVAGASA